MAVNYGIPFGPTARPGFMVTGVYFFDDFIGSSFSATDNAAVWDLTSDTSTDTDFAADEPNGAIQLTPNEIGVDASIELNGLPFTFDWSADQLFECRFKTAGVAANANNIFIGLAASGIDLASGSVGGIEAAAIGLLVRADGSESDILAYVGDGTNETSDDTGSNLAAATYVVYTWKWHARSQTLRHYVDGVRKVTQSVADGDAIPADATRLTMVINVEGQSGTPQAVDVDYVLYAGDRTN